MSVIKAFSEWQDEPGMPDPVTGGVITYTGAGLNSWCRAGFALASPANLNYPLDTNLTEGWLHFRFISRTLHLSTHYPIALLGQNGTIWGGLYMTGGSGSWQVNAHFLGAPVTIRAPGNGTVDIHFRLHATTGFLNIYADGVGIYSFSGNTLGSSGITSIDRLRLQPADAATTLNSAHNILAEVLVSTQPTINAKVVTLNLTGAGALQQWGGAVGDINSATDADSTFIFESTPGDIATYLAADLPTLGVSEIITQVKMNFRANVEAGSPVTRVSPVMRIGGTNYFGSQITPAGTVGKHSSVFNTSPATATAWTAAEVNGLEMGWRADA